jgi:uncharacterized protein YuzE
MSSTDLHLVLIGNRLLEINDSLGTVILDLGNASTIATFEIEQARIHLTLARREIAKLIGEDDAKT